MSEAKQQLYPGIRNPMADIIDKLHAVTDENQSLKDWQARALPWIEAECEQIGEALAMRKSFKEMAPDGFMTKELWESITMDLWKNHAELRQLLIDAGGGE